MNPKQEFKRAYRAIRGNGNGRQDEAAAFAGTTAMLPAAIEAIRNRCERDATLVTAQRIAYAFADKAT